MQNESGERVEKSMIYRENQLCLRFLVGIDWLRRGRDRNHTVSLEYLAIFPLEEYFEAKKHVLNMHNIPSKKIQL